jgi:hypothetical protein
VGWLGALTGDQAVWGNNEFNTVKMLFEEYNAKGGIQVAGKMYKLQAIGYDSKGDAQEAVNVTKRLTGQDKVVRHTRPQRLRQRHTHGSDTRAGQGSRHSHRGHQSQGDRA